MIKYYVIVCDFYMEEKMSLSEFFSKNSSVSNKSDNNQGNTEHKQEHSPFEGFRNYTLTWKERYEIAVRFGILVQTEGEKIEVPDFVKVKEISEEEKNKMLADLSKNQEGQLMSHSKVSEFINIEDKLLENGISAGELKDKYLKELTIINLYLHKLIPDYKKDKVKIIIEINKHIKNAIGSAAKNLDSNYIIDFIDVLYNQFGDKIKPGKYNTIITRMAQSDNNQMLLELVRTITEDFDFQDYEMLLTIIEILQKKKVFPPEHEVSLDDYSNDERTRQRYDELKESNDLRNFDLSMLRDIILATDFKEKKSEDIENLIKKLSQLTSKNINDFWIKHSGMKASYETMINRLNKYIEDQNNKKRELNKPSIKERRIFCVTAIAGGASILFLAGSLLNGKTLKSEKPIPTTYVSDHLDKKNSITGKLSENLPIGEGYGVLKKGTKVNIIPGKNPEEFILETPDIVITPEILNDNKLLAKLIEDLLQQQEDIQKQKDSMISDKIDELDEPEEPVEPVDDVDKSGVKYGRDSE